MKSADGGAGGNPSRVGEPTSSEKMSESVRESIREKRRRRASGVAFADEVVRGIEPTPVYSNPSWDYWRSRRGT